jgi:hypothetical protein
MTLRGRTNKADNSKVETAKHDNVIFEFFEQYEGDIESYYPTSLKGTVLIRKDEMVIDIRDPEGASTYLIIGKQHKFVYRGRNTAKDATADVQAKWVYIDGEYIGLWIEDNDRMVFIFELP